MNQVRDLSEALKKIYEYEIGRGNQIERVDRPAGSNCPLAIIFRAPLDVSGFVIAYGMPTGVKTWENRDSHYPLEKGYVCESTHHALAGPLR